MSIIYRKTTKGVSEIETRVHRLPPRARSTLILVDGKRDELALKGMIAQQADELLAMLLDQGFIEVAGESSPPVPPPAAPPPAAKPPPSIDFEARRRAAVREVNEVLGPAGESLAIRMERAADASELSPLIQMAAQVISVARNRAAAEAFAARHRI